MQKIAASAAEQSGRGVIPQVLTLPIYADLPTDTVDRICDLILG